MVINECKRCARIIVLSSLFSTALSLQCGYQSTFLINQHATPVSSIHSPRASRHLPLQTYRHMKRARCGRLLSTKVDENGDDASNEVREFDVYMNPNQISIYPLSFSCNMKQPQSKKIKKSVSKHIQSAIKKFKARPAAYLLIPVIAAFVGWFTNYLAVEMIFYPIEFRGIPIWRREGEPLGLLGWQGIVPAKTYKMSETMVTMVTTQLLNVEEVFRRLDPNIVASTLGPEVPKLMESIGGELVPLSWTQKAGRALFFSLPGRTKAAMSEANHRFLHDFTVSMQDNIGTLLNIKSCVINQMMQDRALLGQLFRKCGQAELDFLTNSGLWFGFMLGIIQMVVALFWENPWALSIGGAIVGLATNWLALKWIFEPVNPTKVGPFILQGQFLRRQQEVAKEFSAFFANNVLTSEKLWDSILNDPSTKSSFGLLFTNHLKKFANVLSGGVGFLLPGGILTKASASALEKLPNHLHVLHPYVDMALGLQYTLRTQMEKMTSAKFERVVRTS
jgi:uncharacterized membrane protein YheB (UPF0754 family)